MRRLARSRRRRAGARPADGTRIEQLQAAATSAAELARASYLTFLLFGFYLAIIFAGTDHEQLLRETPIRLPILDVELPLMGFYWVAPALFLVAHGNLLIQLQLLAGSLHRLDREIERLPAADQGDARARVFPFAFAHMLIGRQHDRVEQRLLAWVVWITMVLFPLVLLLLAQIRFLPYHDAATTWCHRLLVTLDLLLLWLYWPRILDREHERRSLLAWLGHRLNPLRWPGMTWRALRVWRIAQPQLQVLRSLTALTLLLAWLAVTVPEELLAKMAVDRMFRPDGSPPLIARTLSLSETTLLRTRPPPELIEQLGDEEAAFSKYGEGLALAGRDLRFANFGTADLRKADFEGAELQGANLEVAELQGADLRRANLWRALVVDDDTLVRLWQHADLRGISFEPIGQPVDYVDQIKRRLSLSEERRRDVVAQLRSALVDPGRPAMPVLPSTTIDEHGLARALEQIACGGEADPYAAVGIAWRILSNNGEARRHSRLVAEALLNRCPSAEPLLKPFRADLEQLLALPFDPSQTKGGAEQ